MRQVSTERNAQILLLVVVFIFALKFFQSTPFEILFFQLQAVFLGLILIFLVLYVSASLLNKERPNTVVGYFLILIAVIPLYSAYRASVAFGQPFIYGFLSERGWLLIGVGVWFYNVLITKKMTLATVESAFLFMAWGSLMFFSVFVLTYDPSQLQGADGGSGMVRMSQDRGLRFKFQLFFITFGSIYYFIKYAVYRDPKDIVLLFVFLAYVLFVVQGRTYMIFLAVTFLFYYWRSYPVGELIPVVLKLAYFIFVSILLMYVFMQDYIDRMSYLFLQMFEVLQGEKSQDMSANARIFQSEIVYDYFDGHPLSLWLGTGGVSKQWNDGYNAIFGYFYPSDIGMLGGVFVYGVIGTFFICLIPIIVIIKTVRKVSTKQDVFILAIKYLLVYYVFMFVQGSFYFSVTGYIIPLFILLAYIKLKEKSEC